MKSPTDELDKANIKDMFIKINSLAFKIINATSETYPVPLEFIRECARDIRLLINNCAELLEPEQEEHP